jgi:hypothetical protein
MRVVRVVNVPAVKTSDDIAEYEYPDKSGFGGMMG